MADGDRQSTPEFRDELIGAADHLGIPVLAVEKDYWVSRALRGMAAARADGFIFKGGTRITKGWRIGNRFSERASTGRSASPIPPTSPATARCSITSGSSSATPAGRHRPRCRR